MNRDLVLKSTLLVAALAAVVVCGWAAGGTGGILTALAIGTGCALAVFAGGRRGCSPHFLRRRD